MKTRTHRVRVFACIADLLPAASFEGLSDLVVFLSFGAREYFFSASVDKSDFCGILLLEVAIFISEALFFVV